MNWGQVNWGHAQKNAIKTAIATVVACAIALAFNWKNPAWAGFAVIFPRMPYAGLTLHRSILFMLGSLAGVLAGVTIIGAADQSAWFALTLLSMWFGSCIFVARRKGTNFGWNISGVVAVIIFLSCIFRPGETYEIALYRLLETCLGLTVGTIINGLIWPELELPAIRDKLDLIRQECIRYIVLLRNSLAGENSSTELGNTAQRITELFAETETLFVSVRRNTLNPVCLTGPSLTYFQSRTLARRLFALGELLRDYVDSSQLSISAPWFIEWLNTEADRLSAMDWRDRSHQTLPPSETRLRGEIDRYLSESDKYIDVDLRGLTICVAARDVLASVSEASDEISRGLNLENQDAAQLLEEQGEAIGSSLPRSSSSDDAWKGLAAAVSVLIAGGIWYATRLPAFGIALMMSAVMHLVYGVSRILPIRSCLSGLALGWFWGFVTLIIVMPRLDGIYQLALALFIPIFAIDLVKEVPRFTFVGLFGFVAFICLLVLQDQEPSFIFSSQRFADSMISHVVGVGVSIFVAKLLVPKTAGQELRERLLAIIQQASVLTAFNRTHTAFSRPALGLELRRMVLLINDADFWRRALGRNGKQEQSKSRQLLQTFRAVAFTLTQLEKERGLYLAILPADVRESENSLHRRHESILHGFAAKTMAKSAETFDEIRALEAALRTFTEDHVHALREQTNAYHAILSICGRYHAVLTTLRSTARALDQCDFDAMATIDVVI